MPDHIPMSLLQGTLDMLILRTLIFGPRHGHGIAVTIQRTSEDDLLVDHGSLYPALQRLERQHLIRSKWGVSDLKRRARFYELSARRAKETDRGNGQMGTHGTRHRTCAATTQRGRDLMFWRGRGRLDEEVASHLAEETADNIARGMDPAAARDSAVRAFGNVEAAKETVRERNPWYWLDTFWQDIRFGFRLIARSRWLSATIVATLTTGIALNVSVFSLVNGYSAAPVGAQRAGDARQRVPSILGRLRPSLFRRRNVAA